MFGPKELPSLDKVDYRLISHQHIKDIMKEIKRNLVARYDEEITKLRTELEAL